MATGPAHGSEMEFWREQEAETNSAAPNLGSDTGHVVPVGPGGPLSPSALNNAEGSLSELCPESNTGREAVGNEMDTMPTVIDRRLGTGTTVSVVSRPKRSVKPIERLVIGNPSAWHFNRAKPRK